MISQMILLALRFYLAQAELGYAEVHLGSPTVIKSPDYPKSLGPQVQMEWSVTADMGYRIKVIFQEFNLPANHDCKQLFLNIAEGDSTVMNKADNRICGGHPAYFVTKSSKVSIFLRSDSDPKRGAMKNFVLRLEKTREQPTHFAAGQWAGKAVGKPAVPKTKYGGMGAGYGSSRNMAPHKPAMAPIRPAPGPRYPPPSKPVAMNPVHSYNVPKKYGAGNGGMAMSPRAPPNAPPNGMSGNANYGHTGNVFQESETSKMVVEEEEEKSSSISYALPLGLLAMVLLLAAALFLVKRFLISEKREKEHRVHN